MKMGEVKKHEERWIQNKRSLQSSAGNINENILVINKYHVFLSVKLIKLYAYSLTI